jgi:hypothetical protein
VDFKCIFWEMTRVTASRCLNVHMGLGPSARGLSDDSCLSIIAMV